MRKILALLLLVLVAMAGCLQAEPAGEEGIQPLEPAEGRSAAASAAAPPGQTDGPPVSAAADLAPRLHETGFPTIEPTMGVHPDGTLFMSASAMSNDYVRSRDGGLSWESVKPSADPLHSSSPLESNDPFVHVDPDTGRFFALDQYGLQCSWLMFSDDRGDTWTANPLGCGAPPGLFDHPSLTTAKPRLLPTHEYPNLVVLCANHPNVGNSCTTSHDGGQTFGPSRLVFPAASERGPCGGLAGHVAAAPDGTLYLPKGHCGVPMVGVSDDDGLTWRLQTISTRVETQSHEVRVALDAAGGVHALWMGNDGLPYLASSQDAGATWSKPRMVAPPNVTATDFPAIVAGRAGRIAFAYLGTHIEGGYTAPPPAGLDAVTGYAAVPPNATWHAFLGIMGDAHATNAVVETVALTPDDPLARGQCGRMRCPGVLDFISMTRDTDGRPWVALSDACRGACATDADAPNADRDGWIGLVGTIDFYL